jgi:hypothetical protein
MAKRIGTLRLQRGDIIAVEKLARNYIWMGIVNKEDYEADNNTELQIGIMSPTTVVRLINLLVESLVEGGE